MVHLTWKYTIENRWQTVAKTLLKMHWQHAQIVIGNSIMGDLSDSMLYLRAIVLPYGSHYELV
jgi:hypothetical protein